MNIEIFTQPNLINGEKFCLGDEIKSLLLSKKPKYSEVSFFFGLVKDTAYDEIYEELKSFILNGGKVSFYLSLDKKGNTKKVINSLLELGADVYLFNDNSSAIEFQYKTVVFISSKTATALLSSGNFTTSGLFDGYNLINRLTYDLADDAEEFNKFYSTLLSDETTSLFNLVERENIDDLVKPYQSEKIIPSIEEFTHKDIEEEPIITSLDDDISIDIEIDEDVEFLVTSDLPPKQKKETTEEKVSPSKKVIPEPIEVTNFDEPKYYMEDDALDIEDMLFANSSISVPTQITPVKEETTSLPILESEEEIDSSETKIIAKATNLSKTSIFMLQLPKITQRGAAAGEIKIPTYLRDLIPAFWGWPKEYSVKNGTSEKTRICKFKIIDTKVPNETITDENVKLFQRPQENSFIILSEELVKLSLEESDIMRLIKTESADGIYFTCEIIRKDANEYPIWEQFCTTLLKGSKRKYGMM